MTTYLATTPDDSRDTIPAAWSLTEAFCSSACRATFWGAGIAFVELCDDDHYEFDETCVNCGVVIPASEPALAEIFTSMEGIAKLAGLL